jgi:hypothetical protein
MLEALKEHGLLACYQNFFYQIMMNFPKFIQRREAPMTAFIAAGLFY